MQASSYWTANAVQAQFAGKSKKHYPQFAHNERLLLKEDSLSTHKWQVFHEIEVA